MHKIELGLPDLFFFYCERSQYKTSETSPEEGHSIGIWKPSIVEYDIHTLPHNYVELTYEFPASSVIQQAVELACL